MTDPLNVRVTGPLLPYLDGFSARLAERGYTPLSAANQVRVMAHLSRWMACEGVEAGELSTEVLAEFLRARRAAGYSCWLSERGLAPLLGFLRGVGVAPEPVAVCVEGPVEELLAVYRDVLVRERGLAAATVVRHLATARFFFVKCVGSSGLDVGELTGRDVRGFVLRECGCRSVADAKNLVSSLRSLLRFLFAAGRVPSDLSLVVPAVAGWRGGSLPKALDGVVVARLLASCDQRTAVGRRDLAILTVLSRLGLRASEVAALQLGDIDWRSGDMAVRGKGDRRERLPLPADVGEVLVAYLRQGRPRSEHRAVFLGVRAPHGPASATAVKLVVRHACARAGVPEVGAHRLRHSAATQMLRAGAPLSEIGQVLRHRSMTTTAIYAKVDTEALRELALPWPGGAR